VSGKITHTSEAGALIFFDVWKLTILQALRFLIYDFVRYIATE
jgi:hypothetical protein